MVRWTVREVGRAVQNSAIGMAILVVACSGVFVSILAQKLAATKQQVADFVGHTDVRLVFRQGNDIYYVDYTEASPELRKFPDLTGAFLPVISPDGQWITYQTGCSEEGGSGRCSGSSIYLRRFAETATAIKIMDNGYVPRFTFGSTATDPEVVYATTVNCLTSALEPWDPNEITTICYNVGQTAKRRINGGATVQPEEILYASGAFYGGLSYDNRYLCTAWPAGPGAFMLDLQNKSAGVQLIHYVPVKNDSTGQDSLIRVGCCNPSRSASRIFTNTMMYFDFGFSGNYNPPSHAPRTHYSHPMWGNWAQHETFFIGRFVPGRNYGEPIRVYGLPNDQYYVRTKPTINDTTKPVALQWANPEWTNHPYYATMSLLVDRLFRTTRYEHTMLCEAIYLINLYDKTCLRLVTTTDTSFTSTVNMIYPYVWVKVPETFVEDPQWLASLDPSRPELASVPVRRGTVGRDRLPLRGSVMGGTLAVTRELASVKIYSVSGKIRWASARLISRPSLTVALPALEAGMYLIVAESTDGQRLSLRWLVRR